MFLRIRRAIASENPSNVGVDEFWQTKQQEKKKRRFSASHTLTL